MARVLSILILTLLQQGGGLDIDKVLEKADKLLEEAKSSYEEARDKSNAAGFVDAGFKLEDARIKYLVLQEIGAPDKQKIAGDRLRAVNQLAKLIHDGRVAVSGVGVGVGDPTPKPVDPAPNPDPAKPEVRPEPKPDLPNALALKPPPDVRVRLVVPDLAKQKEAEKIIKDILKEQYAKKAPADRQALAKLLLQQTKDASNDPAALWVMYREAQDTAVQVCDVPTILASIEGAAVYFDIDALAMKNAALSAAGKNGRTPDDFSALTRAMLALSDEFVAADQYDIADKTAAAALLAARKTNDVPLTLKATNRTREVAEAKTRFQGMKGSLATLAKNPDDPAANNDMGQLLCFVKGNWELGVRFLVKGSDPALKALAEKEMAMSLQPMDQVALGDGWWDLAEKEKSPLRKSQMQVHARGFYEAALPGLTSLQRIKVEKRLEVVEPANPGAINLIRMIDLNKDVVAGIWKLSGDKLSSDSSQAARVEFPYEPPAEYDLKMVFIRNDGTTDVFATLSKDRRAFNWSMGAGQDHYGFGMYKSYWVADAASPAAISIPNAITNGKVHTALVQIRKDALKGFLDGKLIKELAQPYADLSVHGQLRLRNDSILGVGSYNASTTFIKIELVEVTGKGKKIR